MSKLTTTMQLFTLAALLFITLFISAQTRVLDSLQKRINEETVDSLRQKIYLNMANATRNTELSKCVQYALQANALNNKTNKPILLARGYDVLSVVYRNMRKLDSAVTWAEMSLKVRLANNINKELPNSYTNLGNIYMEKSDYATALKYGEKALEIAIKNNDSVVIARQYDNLANVLTKQGKRTEEIEYRIKATSIREALQDNEGLLLSYGNLGTAYKNFGDAKTGMGYLKKALVISKTLEDKSKEATMYGRIANTMFDMTDAEFATLAEPITTKNECSLDYHFKALAIRKQIGDSSLIATSYSDIAYNYFHSNQYNKALEYELIAFNIEEKLDPNSNGTAIACGSLGEMYMQKNDFATAEKYFNRSMVLAKELGIGDLILDNYKYMAQLYQKKGNYKLAYEYNNQYYTIRDSVNSDENKKKFIAATLKFDYDKKAVADSVQHANETFITNAKLTKERATKWGFGIVALVSLIAGFITYRQYQQKQKINANLAKANENINKQNTTLKQLNTDLIESEDNLLQANDTKEQLISIMSHDLMNPITAVLNYQTALESNLTTMDAPAAQNAITKMGNAIKPIYGLLNNMLQWAVVQKNEISPKLTAVHINKILEETIALYKNPAELKEITIETNATANDLITTDEMMFKFIVRNIIDNAIKNSPNKKAIRIKINEDNNNTTVTIDNEGNPINETLLTQLNNPTIDKHNATGTGVGMNVSKQFASALGLKLSFENISNYGCRVLIAKPNLG